MKIVIEGDVHYVLMELRVLTKILSVVPEKIEKGSKEEVTILRQGKVS